MKLRPDMLDAKSPAGIEVVQLTNEAVPSSHIYMEAQIFTPDSRRLILHRSAHAHGGDKDDTAHRYLLCDLEENCALTPIAEELGVTGPSVSPDGRWLYYFVNRTEPGGGTLTLKRVRLDGTERETVMVVDTALPGTPYRPSRIYPLSTISSDGERIAISGFLGDGNTEDAPWGLMVFDIVKASVALIISGQSWCNMHPQYCRSTDPAAAHDILIQENHDNKCDPQGNIIVLVGGKGADIHVLLDDGADFRTMPWGRDGDEYCQGHQCWLGRSARAVTSTWLQSREEHQLIGGIALPDQGHLGRMTPGGQRTDLSRDFPAPHFWHFATDIAGTRLVTDYTPHCGGGALYVADIPAPGQPLANYRYLLETRSSGNKDTHAHPFLSQDGRLAFFNSDESGVLQAYLVRGIT